MDAASVPGMKWVSASFVRQNFARVMDDAIREPIAVTSHGRARVLIVDASLSERLLDVIADAGPAQPEPPKYPWLDKSLKMHERIDALVARKAEVKTRPTEEWTDEDWDIIWLDRYNLPE